MKEKTTSTNIYNWILGIPVFAIGILFLILVHPVPGIVCLLVSLMYLPKMNAMLLQKFGFKIPLALKIIVCIGIIWFTLGVSDLGDMVDSRDEVRQEKFDKTKWEIKEDRKYPFRDKMLNDLMTNYKLHGLKGDSVVTLLGTPNRTQNNHLYYTIAQTFFANTAWPLFTKTLVIKLKSDSTVE